MCENAPIFWSLEVLLERREVGPKTTEKLLLLASRVRVAKTPFFLEQLLIKACVSAQFGGSGLDPGSDRVGRIMVFPMGKKVDL